MRERGDRDRRGRRRDTRYAGLVQCARARSREAQARAMTVTTLPDRVLCGHCTKSARAVLDFVQNADRIVIAGGRRRESSLAAKTQVHWYTNAASVCMRLSIDCKTGGMLNLVPVGT
jgi:hypothetical protein